MKNMRGAIDLGAIAVGGMLTVALGFAAFMTATTSMLQEKIETVKDSTALNASAIGVLKEQTGRIPYLEGKVDKLLENENIDPKKVLPAAVIQSTVPSDLENPPHE